ncbi:MAG: lamin tail domain-containing protein [Candidatus Coatesbacteria bacterium]|nr:MAG: lamin tail domain-containing protein [Candidatus Coatesbacteria bacterium]
MRSLTLKYVVSFVFIIAFSAGAKVFVSEVHYLPDGDGPPAFIEFYNSSESNVDLADWVIETYRNGTGTANITADSIIPAYGFFLVGFIDDESAWTEFSYTPDCYTELKFTGDFPGGVALYDVTGEYVDAIGWGVVPEDYYEGEPFILVTNGHSIERKSGQNHNELRGNSYDTDNNLNDCRERTDPQPQNIHSPREYPSLNAEQESVGYIKAMYDYQ